MDWQMLADYLLWAVAEADKYDLPGSWGFGAAILFPILTMWGLVWSIAQITMEKFR